MSQKNSAKLFLSELHKMSINFDNFWHMDSTKDQRIVLCGVHSFSISPN